MRSSTRCVPLFVHPGCTDSSTCEFRVPEKRLEIKSPQPLGVPGNILKETVEMEPAGLIKLSGKMVVGPEEFEGIESFPVTGLEL